MRRWSLALLLSAASPAFAQEAQEAPAAPAPAPAPAAAPTATAAPAAEQAPAGDAAPAEKPSRRRRKQQEGEAEAPAPAAQAPAAAAPAAAAPAAEESDHPAPMALPQPGNPVDRVRDEARYLLSYLLTGDVRGSVPILAFPFQLEERRFDSPESLVVTWVKQLRNKRTDLVTLYDIEVLPYAEMEKKYGKPPARLGAIAPARGTEVYAAVANLSGHAAVILYRQEGSEWKAFAYTD